MKNMTGNQKYVANKAAYNKLQIINRVKKDFLGENEKNGVMLENNSEFSDGAELLMEDYKIVGNRFQPGLVLGLEIPLQRGNRTTLLWWRPLRIPPQPTTEL